MNWYSIFYWLTVADSARILFTVLVIIFTAFSVITSLILIFHSGDDDSDNADVRAECWKYLRFTIPIAMLFWALLIFTPDRKSALLIIAGGGTLEYLSNDSTARQIPHEALNFVVVQLKSMSQEANVDLNIQTARQKVIERAKNMTADQLIREMAIDSSFRNILLQQ